MAVDVTLLNSNSLNNIQENFERIQEALEDVVGRSGDLPNEMGSDIDLDGNDILNVRAIDVEVLSIGGIGVIPDGVGYTITDGDKGDITISGAGTVYTIDTGVVDTIKLGGNITTAGKALLDDVDASAQRGTLGLGTIATQNSNNVTVTGGTITGLTSLATVGQITTVPAAGANYLRIGSGGANTLDRGIEFTNAANVGAGYVVVVPNTVATDSVMNFYVGGSAGGDLKLSIDDAGLVDVKAGQIKFPATANPSANVNTLDDYEEGTFTPTIVGTTVAGVGTYTRQVGTYTKIGNIVHFYIDLAWSAHTGTGNIRVAGLPFSGVAGQFPPVTVIPDSLTFSNNLAAYVNGDTNINLQTFSTGAAGAVVAIDTAASLYLNGTYRTA